MSYRNDTYAPYDLNLLSGVPDPTRPENQVGYNEGRDRRASFPPPAPNRRAIDQQPLTDGTAIARPSNEGRTVNDNQPAVAKGPWYCTKWGIVATVIANIIITGAIVGGVVGGTHHGSSKRFGGGGSGGPNGSSTPSQSNATSSNQGGFYTTTQPVPVEGPSPSS